MGHPVQDVPGITFTWKKYSLGFWSDVCLKRMVQMTRALAMVTMMMVMWYAEEFRIRWHHAGAMPVAQRYVQKEGA